MNSITKIPFALVVLLLAATSQAQDTRALTLGPKQDFPHRLFGFNTNLMAATAFHGINYSDRRFSTAVSELKPNVLRFPGGTIANNYRWRQDSFDLPAGDKTGWAAKRVSQFRKSGRKYDRAGFISLCQQFDIEPIWVLNVYDESPQSVLELLAELKKAGVKLHAIELANEPYWDPRSFNNVWKYIEVARPVAQAIRRAEPEIQIGACFGPLGKKFGYESKWNQVLAKQKWYDAVVYHEYFGGQGIAVEKGEKLPVEQLVNPSEFISTPAEYFAKLLPGNPVWMTEWNIGREGLNEWKNTGAELQFLASTYCDLVEHRDVFQLACLHQIYEQGFGTFHWNPNKKEIVKLPSYQLHLLLAKATDGATHVRRIRNLPDSTQGFAAANDDETRLFLVNSTNKAQRLSLPAAIKRATLLEVPPKSRPADFKETELDQSTNASATFVLPAHTICLIVL